MTPFSSSMVRIGSTWPAELLPLFERAVTVEHASLTRAGAPVTYPLTPYVGANSLDVSTGLTYPAKAERARRNPKVALLYSDGLGSGLENPPIALVQGLATVRDADVQANTDRYVRLTMAKLPAAYAGTPRFMLRSLAWYFARIWIEVTPTRILWWPGGRLDEPPRQWVAPAGTAAPPSDPAPPGGQPGAWSQHPVDWHRAAELAVRELSMCDLTFVGADGFPVCVPVQDIRRRPEGFQLRVPRVPGFSPAGPACLTFHTHDETFTAQQNRVFVGHIPDTDDDPTVRLDVRRVLGSWSVPGNKLGATVDLIRKGRMLRPRLHAECARRGRPVPRGRLPGEHRP